MKLKEFIEREKDFKKFGNGIWESVSLRDKEGETIKVVPLNELDQLEDQYLNAKFLTIGSNTRNPNRLIICIDI